MFRKSPGRRNQCDLNSSDARNICMNRHYLFPLLVVVCVAGCGGRNTADYYPQGARSKQALTISLEAWKTGGSADPAGKLSSGQTVIAVDTDWSSGQKLSSYEVGQEIPAEADGPRKISVKLTYADGKKV